VSPVTGEPSDPDTRLELDQFVASTSRPVRRAQLGGWAQAGLWALRVAAVVLGAMVIYTFVYQLGH
jgi:hypothetical protein